MREESYLYCCAIRIFPAICPRMMDAVMVLLFPQYTCCCIQDSWHLHGTIETIRLSRIILKKLKKKNQNKWNVYINQLKLYRNFAVDSPARIVLYSWCNGRAFGSFPTVVASIRYCAEIALVSVRIMSNKLRVKQPWTLALFVIRLCHDVLPARVLRPQRIHVPSYHVWLCRNASVAHPSSPAHSSPERSYSILWLFCQENYFMIDSMFKPICVSFETYRPVIESFSRMLMSDTTKNRVRSFGSTVTM